jgi:hypothetical protein
LPTEVAFAGGLCPGTRATSEMVLVAIVIGKPAVELRGLGRARA